MQKVGHLNQLSHPYSILIGVSMNPNIFPVTVIVAISLFLIKEFVELYRRVMADKRKISAMKKLLANEIDRSFKKFKI